VIQYKIKGYWYFDARQGELKYRLLGICPLAPGALDKIRAAQTILTLSLLNFSGYIFRMLEKCFIKH